MRGEERRQRAILMIMGPGDRVPKEHPLRRVKELADKALTQLSALFNEMYSSIGRPSIPPERLLKASLLMALYSVRSERMLCEQLGYNLLFRYFLDLDLIEEPFDHSSFSRNRGRLLAHEVATLSYLANALMDNRHGLLTDLQVGIADGFCEREQALAMLAAHAPRATSV